MSIDPKQEYSARETAALLEVTEQTALRYFRNGELRGRKVGPKKRWFTSGDEIIKMRKKWGYPV